MDRSWRQQAARECLVNKPQRVLDLACGTGDLAITIARGGDNSLNVAALDFSQPMLEIARRKAQTARLQISFIAGDAAALPFPDSYFDTVGISFAWRNLTYKHPNAAHHLAEVRRVLRTGGRFVIVESSQPRQRIIRALDHFYLRTYAYRMGHWLTGNRNAYHYLTLSATRYYNAAELKELLLNAHFQEVKYRLLFFGAAAIHVAIK